ncbi:MAG: hypothetical protein ACLF0G_07150 [Candidatus Brocadiia bacterium]
MARPHFLRWLKSGKGLALVALCVLVALAVGAWITVRRLTSPERLARMVREQLEEKLGGEASVGAVEFDLLAGATVRDIELRASPQARPWASVRELHVAHRLGALLGGRFEAETVRAVGPRLVLNDASIERLRRMPKKPPAKGRPVAAIAIEDGTLIIEPTDYLPGVPSLELAPLSLQVSCAGGRVLRVEGDVGTAAGRLAFTARLDPSLSTAHVAVTSGDIALHHVPRGWLADSVRSRPEVAGLEGHVAGRGEGRIVWGGAEPSLRYTVAVRFEDVRVPLKDFPLPLERLAGEATVRPGRVAASGATGRVGTARLRLDELQLRFGPSGAVSQLFAAGEVRNAPLDERLREALPKSIREVWQGLGVTSGLAHVTVRYSQEGDAAPDLALAADCREVQLQPKDHPYPLPPIAGRIEYDSALQVVRLNDIEGSDGQLSVRLDGRLRLAAEEPRYRLHAVLDGLRLDQQLRGALPDELATVWKSLGVQGGEVDADLVASGKGGEAPRLTAELALHRVRLRLADFPYPLPPLHGRVRVAPDRTVQLDEIAGSRGHLAFRAAGTVDASGKEPVPRLRVAATGLPMDAELLDAAPKSVRDAVAQAGLSGAVVDADLLIDGKEAVTAQVTLHEGSAVPKTFPYRLDELRGRLRWTGDALLLESVTGKHGSARLAVWGQIGLADREHPTVQLRAEASRLALDEELRAALPADVREKLEPHDPAGVVDLRVSYLDEGKEPPRVRLAAALHGADVSLGASGPRLRGLRGEARFDGRTLTLAGVRGRLGAALVELEGAVALSPEAGQTALQFRLPARAVEDIAAEELPKPVAEALKALDPRGTLSASGVVRTRKGEARPYLARATGELDNVWLATEPPVQRLNGAVMVAAATDEAATDVVANIAQARVAGLLVQALSGRARLTPKTLDVTELDWSVCGGRVVGEFHLDSFDPLTYWGTFDISRVDVESLVSDLGGTKNLPSGWLRGSARFHGHGEDIEGLVLEATCKVDRGRLYELPLMVSVLNVLSLQLPGKGTLTDAHAEFALRERVLHINQFLLTGRAAPVGVTGTIQLEPGVRFDRQKIDLVFTAVREPRLLDKLPVVGWLKAQSYDRLTRQFLQARATGTLAEPEVQYLLKPLMEPIGKFWTVLRRVTGEGQPTEKPE